MLVGEPMTMCCLLAVCPYVPISHRFFIYRTKILMSTIYDCRGLNEITYWPIVNDTFLSFSLCLGYF